MKKIRNILSIALVFVMLIGFAPVNVFADEAGPQGPSPVVNPEDTPADGKGGQPSADTDVAGQEYKTEAVNKIKDLKNLEESEKNDIIAKINDTTVTTKKAVDEIVADATKKDEEKAKEKAKEKELAEAKEAAKEELAKLDNLTKDQSDQATKAIDDAKSPENVNKALEEAKKQNAANELAKAKEDAKKKVEEDNTIKDKDKAKKAIDAANSPEDVQKALDEAKKAAENPPAPGTGDNTNPPAPAAVEHDIIVRTTGNGTAKATPSRASKDATITVTADPAYGYVVDRIVVRDGKGNPLTLSNKKYKNYYDDYPYYLRSRWYNDYPYDYDDYIRWCDRNGYSRYDSDNYRIWCRRYGYRYDYDDFKRWDDFYDYRWYNRYNYNYSYNYQADFTMPASAVTVEVTFTSAPYWYDGYFYDYETGTYRYYYDDDYYYYRNRRNKKSNYYERQAEKDKKEEETKVVEEKKNDTIVTKAVISIGSNMIDKVSNDLHTKRLMDAPAYVKDGRVMLPLRFVAEALGLQVSWIKDNRTVVIQDMLFRVEIPVDTNNITVNGITSTSDVKPEIVNGRVMLPIANIARALGLVDGRDIVWNAATKEVTLTRTITK